MARLDRARRNAEDLGYFRDRQVAVIDQGEHGSLVVGQLAERPLELVAQRNCCLGVACGLVGGLQIQCDDRPVRPAPDGLAIAQDDPVRPRIEPIRIAQTRKVPPDLHERGLQGVTGGIAVSEDSLRESEQPVTDPRRKLGEGLAIALLRPFDEAPVHCDLRPVGSSTDST